jgi:uncharacterized protein YecT (DUF1311 family)
MRTWIVFAFLILASSSFGYAQGLSQQELDALRARLMQNWNPPVDNGGYAITLRVRLNRDGTFQMGPQVLTTGSGSQFNATRDSAVRTVLKSAPFTMLSQQSYEAWKEFDFTFDPRIAQYQAPASKAEHTSAPVNTPAIPRSTGKPSFDCSKATSASARLICSDAELSKADGELGAAFRTAVTGKDEAGKKQLNAEQLAWLRERNNRCGVGPDKASVSVDSLIDAKPCIIRAIQAQISSFTAATQVAQTASNAGPPAINSESNYYVANTKPPDAFLSLRTEPSTTAGRRIAQMPNGTVCVPKTLSALMRRQNRLSSRNDRAAVFIPCSCGRAIQVKEPTRGRECGSPTSVDRLASYASVRECAVIARSVAISVLVSGFTSKEENEWRRLRRRNAALPLATIVVVNVADAIVNTTGLESRNVGELLIGSFNVEAEFPKSASGLIFTAAKFIGF